LAYSPQYGSSKDPVIMIGFSSHDIGAKEVNAITITEFLEMEKKIFKLLM
jgi:hypothetical protein